MIVIRFMLAPLASFLAAFALFALFGFVFIDVVRLDYQSFFGKLVADTFRFTGAFILGGLTAPVGWRLASVLPQFLFLAFVGYHSGFSPLLSYWQFVIDETPTKIPAVAIALIVLWLIECKMRTRLT